MLSNVVNATVEADADSPTIPMVAAADLLITADLVVVPTVVDPSQEFAMPSREVNVNVVQDADSLTTLRLVAEEETALNVTGEIALMVRDHQEATVVLKCATNSKRVNALEVIHADSLTKSKLKTKLGTQVKNESLEFFFFSLKTATY